MIIRPCLFLFSELLFCPILTSTPTTFDYIWKPNSAANCVGIPATDGRPDQKPCLNHGLRTVCPSPVAPKTNIFSAPAVSPHRNSQRCPKLYQGRGSPLHRLNQPARPKTNTTQELTCSYFCALPASVPPSLAHQHRPTCRSSTPGSPPPSAPPPPPRQSTWPGRCYDRRRGPSLPMSQGTCSPQKILRK